MIKKRKIDDCVIGALPHAAHSVRMLLKASFHRTRLLVQRFFEANNTIIENRFAEKYKKYAYPLERMFFEHELLELHEFCQLNHTLADLLFFRFSCEAIFVGFDAKHAVQGTICGAAKSLLSRQQQQREPFCCAATLQQRQPFFLK